MTEQSQGKGRPTPKRSEARQRRGGPVPPPPTSRREAAKALRRKQAEQRQALRRSGRTGDDRLLLPRDRGPVRMLVRDLVDARRSLGWLLLPTAMVVFLASMLKNAALTSIAGGVWLATILGVTIDMVGAGLQIRSVVRSRFPDERKVRGHVAYGLLRTTVLRRFRTPKPQVKRGQRI